MAFSTLPAAPYCTIFKIFGSIPKHVFCRVLVESLARMPQLTRLALEYKGPQPAALAASLQRLINLMHVDLSRCLFHVSSSHVSGSAGAHVVCDALAQLSRLTFLDMAASDATPWFAESVAGMLSSNTNLQHLALRVACPSSGETLHCAAQAN